MALYGHNSREFQPRPSLGTLLVVGFFQFLLAIQFSALILHVFDSALAWSAGWDEVIVLHAPFAGDFMSPFFVSPPLERIYRMASPIVSLSGFALAVLLLVFWPGSSALANRLFVHMLAFTLGAWGVLSVAFRPTAVEGVVAWSGFPALVWQAVFGIAGALIVIMAERRTIQLLGNLFDVQRPGGRFALWACRIPLPTLIVAAIAYLSHFRAGCWALLAAAGLSALEVVLHDPSVSWERIANPLMRTGAVVSAILAIAVVAASVASFGIEAFDRESRVIEISREWGVESETKEALLRKQLRDPESLEKQRDVIRFRGRESEVKPETSNER